MSNLPMNELNKTEACAKFLSEDATAYMARAEFLSEDATAYIDRTNEMIAECNDNAK
jgi:hypothetical protein